MAFPKWDNVLDLYNLTNVKEASAVPDLQRLEVLAGIYFSVGWAFEVIRDMNQKQAIMELPGTSGIGLGCIHRGFTSRQEELEAMEDHKLRYLQSFILRTALSLQDLVRVARTWEENSRNCYAEENAELFIDNGIIVIRRGNAEDVSRLFTTILKETTQTNYRGRGFYYQTVMYLVAAAVCCGLGILIRLSSGSRKMTCQLLREAIPVNPERIGECLENKEIKNPIVVVRGTVGSTSTVDKHVWVVAASVGSCQSEDLKEANE
ncbi:hypothetical protein Bca52824_006323 [Brassica carinata]|uniref:Uncharacterized protein n=1 Tax=Brassica carinata TaxID=52824 RepID=A0A8X7WUJ0_BRACI|nr:hypothetical protein Bca52824_006323 [Brassica carinata]